MKAMAQAWSRSGLRRAVIAFDTAEAPGTVIIDTGNTALYYVLGRAVVTVGVGREALPGPACRPFSRKAEWPDWHPPAEMIARQALSAALHGRRFPASAGARAMYLGSSVYRIHGTTIPRPSASLFLGLHPS